MSRLYKTPINQSMLNLLRVESNVAFICRRLRASAVTQATEEGKLDRKDRVGVGEQDGVRG